MLHVFSTENIADYVPVWVELAAVRIGQIPLATLVPFIELPILLGDQVEWAVRTGNPAIKDVDEWLYCLEGIETNLRNICFFSLRIVVCFTIILQKVHKLYK